MHKTKTWWELDLAQSLVCQLLFNILHVGV